MRDDMTFENLRKQLEAQSKEPEFGKHIDTFKTFVGAAACLVGDAAGGVPAVIAALAAKEKLIDLGKLLLERVCARKPADYPGKAEQMRTACGILCFTAYFDALQALLPEDIRRQTALRPAEQQSLLPPSLPAPQRDARRNSPASAGTPLVFPDAAFGSAGMDKDLRELYRGMTDRLKDFTRGLNFTDTADEAARRNWQTVLDELPDKAVGFFHGQYLTLCVKVPAFVTIQSRGKRATNGKYTENFTKNSYGFHTVMIN